MPMSRVARCFSIILMGFLSAAPIMGGSSKVSAQDTPSALADYHPARLTLEIDEKTLSDPRSLEQIAQLISQLKTPFKIEHDLPAIQQQLAKKMSQKIYSYATQFTKSLQTEEHERKFRILSLDGGGIRGFLTCLFLSHLTHITGKPVHELFDMIIATSTGALIAAGLAIEKPTDQKIDIPNSELMLYTDSIPSPYYTPEELATFYLSDGPQIFSGGSWFSGWSGPQYSDANLTKVLNKFFGNKTLKDLNLPVFLTAYDLPKRKIITYSSVNQQFSEDKNAFLCQVLRGCVAAETIFAPIKIMDKIVADAGVLLNNPASLGLAKSAKHFRVHPGNVILFSSGCGHCIDPKGLETYQRMGIKEWATELLDTMFDGQVTHSCINEFHKATLQPYLYTRINPELNVRNMKTDLTTTENFKALLEAAKAEIKRREGDFKKIGEALAQSASLSSSAWKPTLSHLLIARHLRGSLPSPTY
ncbi:patatin-like phospholipase family protein [Candidatus Odyssella thessalonicensis]|uniref:patatin-like phospholipase family protein n=1 Tax=Candidatus Odyssella thessalonicensis TaxID=84647 RepID=UPI000310716F|nr:patatin-like phospholipase family protein [Candidatus Odyssella thessalonicensis]